MNQKTYIIIGTVLLFVIGFIYSGYRASNSIKTSPSQFVPAMADGVYYVQIREMDLVKKSAVFDHITYFSGIVAFNSAQHEAKCDKKEIEECVSTLKYGYYIRPSDPKSAFSIGISEAKIFLSTSKTRIASLEELKNEINLPEYQPAFTIEIKNNKIDKIEEITRYNNLPSFSLPKGYSLDNYSIEKVTEKSCKLDGDCETPSEYLIRSNCPYTSICLDTKCVVVCPGAE
ncbi:MAG: hypothetical protein WC449_03030 [Candidatus Paceibacterota bacterium]